MTEAAREDGPLPRSPLHRNSLPPGSTIGILGAGQLGRMLAVAAARLGLQTHIYAEASGPAFDVAPASTLAAYDDRAALSAFARAVDAVTFEFENVPVDAASYLAALVPVRPGPKALAIAQDRLSEKTFICELGIAVAPFAKIDNAGDIGEALAALGGQAILKTRRLGYDGKGQIGLGGDADAPAAFNAIGAMPAVLEKKIAFAREISILAVRGLSGELAFYDCPENTHAGGILRRSAVPAEISESTAHQARDIAARIAGALDHVGVLAVEMFVLDGGGAERLIVNEIAPRVHNSGHWTLDACAVSQFENHMRAVAGWPLGTTGRHSDAVMENLIGPQVNEWRQMAMEPDLCLHLYGKRDAREGRKMGHLTRLTPKSRD